jgi:DNA-binding winged helix-turn-helix (wHTH) protein
MKGQRARVESQRSGCWTFGPFELDELRFELRRTGRRLPAQPKVIDLLIFLVKHRDRVVSKDELLDNIWPGVTVCEASLSQVVSLARKLLGDGPRTQDYLRTVRGRGFQFVAPMASVPQRQAHWSQTLDLAEGDRRCVIVQLIDGELQVSLLPWVGASVTPLLGHRELPLPALAAVGTSR